MIMWSIMLAVPIVLLGIIDINYCESDVHGNFRNYFDSIAKHDHNASDTFSKILKKEVAHERQAFDQIKEELWIARKKSSNKKMNFYTENNRDLVKRGTNTNGNTDTVSKNPQNHSVLMVSLTNLCRSPMAAAVFRNITRERKIDSQWHCESAGTDTRVCTGTKPGMDPRAITTLQKYGIEPGNHTIRPVYKTDFKDFDYIFAMDGETLADLTNRVRHCKGHCKAKIELLVNYDPEGETIIRYPYHDRGMRGFEHCYSIVNRSCNAFLDKFSKV